MRILRRLVLARDFSAKPDESNVWSFTTWRDDVAGCGTYSGFGENEAGDLCVANNATERWAETAEAHRMTTAAAFPSARSR